MRLRLLALLSCFLFACPEPPASAPDSGSDAGREGDAGRELPDAGAGDAGVTAEEFAELESLIDALGATSDQAEREALVLTFFESVSWGERGFPMRGEDSFAVALYDTRGGSFSVAGDFNAWSASSHPLEQPIAGFPFFYAIVPHAASSSRSLYKFVRNGTDYFADGWARSFGFDTFGEYSLLEPGEASSHLERWRGFKDPAGVLVPRDLTVYVPAGAHTQGATAIPVLYLQDGQMLFDPSASHGGWRAQVAADEALAHGQIRAVYLVGIHNTAERMNEYTHVADDPFGTGDVGGQADRYAALVAEHIQPFIEARYPVSQSREDTAVAGSSLGGLVSFEIQRRYPGDFGNAAALSATFGWGSIARQNATMMARFAEAPPVGARLYLDSGGNDAGGCLDSDSDGVHDDNETPDNYCETLDMRAKLESLGWESGVDLHYVWSPDAQHTEAAWAARFPGLLRTWFPRGE